MKAKCCRLARSLFGFALAAAPLLAAQPDGTNLPTRWKVHGVGEAGTLELTAGPSGLASGKLLGRNVTGFLAGGRLVLRRTVGDRTEVWEGWLASDSAEPFVAGTVTVSDHSGSRVQPWYAVPELAAKSDETSPLELPPPASLTDFGRLDAPAEPTPAPNESPAVIPPPNPVSTPARVDAAAGERALGQDLTGVWIASDGRVVVTHQGRTLSVLLPDGKRVSGRFTAADTIVVGLHKGCCKGEVHSPDEIRWNDGAVWHRDD